MKNQDLQKEQSLLELAKSDKSKFADLYKYFINDVYRFTNSIVNDKHMAEDITSQVMMKLFENIEKLEWKGVSLKFWLFKVARNLSYLRFRKPVELEFDENKSINYEFEINFVDELMNKDLIERIKKEIQKLNPVEQEIIALRIWEGMQFDEIAKLLEMKLSTCKLKFYRSIEKLKTQIESKNYIRVVSLPLLFTGIRDLGTTSFYQAPQALIASSTAIISGQTTMSTLLTAAKAAITTKLSTTVILAILAILTVTGGGYYTYQAFQSNNKAEQKSENNASTTPIPTNNASITPTSAEVVVTATPTEEKRFITFSDTHKYENLLDLGPGGKAVTQTATLKVDLPTEYKVTSSTFDTIGENIRYKSGKEYTITMPSGSMMKISINMINGIGGMGTMDAGTPILKYNGMLYGRYKDINTNGLDQYGYLSVSSTSCNSICQSKGQLAETTSGGIASFFNVKDFYVSISYLSDSENDVETLEKLISQITFAKG